MNLSRRSFLKITGAGLAVAVAPIAFSKIGSLPVIVGDGVHDDTAGLQAAINGEDFVCLSNLVTSRGGKIHLAGGSYSVTKSLDLMDNMTARNVTVINRITGTRIRNWNQW